MAIPTYTQPTPARPAMSNSPNQSRDSRPEPQNTPRTATHRRKDHLREMSRALVISAGAAFVTATAIMAGVALLSGAHALLLPLQTGTPTAGAGGQSLGSIFVCNGSSPTIIGRGINLIVKAAFSFGLLGGIALWALNKAEGALVFKPEHKKMIKQRQEEIKYSIVGLVFGPPVAQYGMQYLGFGMSKCIDFMPYI